MSKTYEVQGFNKWGIVAGRKIVQANSEKDAIATAKIHFFKTFKRYEAIEQK